MKMTWILVVCMALVVIASPPFKNLQGPPSEFSFHKLPETRRAEKGSDSFSFEVYLDETDGCWSGDISVDSSTSLVVTFASTNAYNFTFDVLSAANAVDLPLPHDVEKSWLGFDSAQDNIPTKSYWYKQPPVGVWQVKVCGPVIQDHVDVQIIVMNESPVLVASHLSSYSTHTDSEFSVVASLKHKISGLQVRADSSDSFVADLDITTPSGEQYIITMHDDGEHQDGNANDGVYGGSFLAKQQGTYTAQAVIKGVYEGAAFVRSSQHLIAVVDKDLELQQDHTVAMDANDHDEDMIVVNLKARNVASKNLIGNKYKAHAQIWATSTANFNMVPVAWLTGMTVAESIEGDKKHIHLPLKMNKKWLEIAGATFPLQIREAYVQDVATSVPITTLAQGKIENSLNLTPSFTNDDESLYFGKRPHYLPKVMANNGGHKLLLVHGYCSATNPFDTNDFTDYLKFEDPSASRTNDEFALLINDFAKDADSISIVAHSQGGLAAVHLLTFYWSKQDVETGTSRRLIQTVGSPFRGSGLAGTIASIGGAFGKGCGKNYDLTWDGAELWLTTIPKNVRSQVWYHTTQYKDYSYCSLAANAVLQWPNDGVTELERANLEGGNNVHHKKSWCHTADLKYPPQCSDHDRNKQMNKDSK
ncbi:cmfA [Acrasis kona]|uniref:CmfA n=1 Tax=Acrasis kona TaxID=1008807 RepID=A0AAW2YVC0_9EUKA